MAHLATSLPALLLVILMAPQFSHAEEGPRFAGRIVLLGPAADGGFGIASIRPDGSDLRAEWKAPSGVYPDGGRVAPDGRSVACTLHRWDDTRDEEYAGRTDPIGILSGGEMRELGLSGIVGGWSADSTRLAVTQLGAAGRTVSVIADVRTAATRDLSIPEHQSIDDWSVDGRLLVMVQRPVAFGFPHRRLIITGTELDHGSPLAAGDFDDHIWGRISPDGSRVAHCHRIVRGAPPDYGPIHCAISNLEGDPDRRLTALCDEQSGHLYAPVRGPCWSPDGREVVWVRMATDVEPPGAEFDLLFVAAGGGPVRRVPLTGVQQIPSIDWR